MESAELKNAYELPRESSRTKLNESYGWLLLLVLLSGFCAGVPLFLIGFFAGSLSNDNRRAENDIRKVQLLFESNPTDYKSLRINRGPADKFQIEGEVETKEGLIELQNELIRTLGVERVDDVFAVEVAEGKLKQGKVASPNILELK